MDPESRTCLYCGKPLHGRIDKKFCNDFCRNSYNNEHNSDANNLMRNINNILRKNRRILKNCLSENEKTTIVTRDALVRNGYNFKYFTHFYDTRKGETYTFCYEYGFLSLSENRFLVVKQRASGNHKQTE